MLSAEMKKQLPGYQRNENTEHHIYRRLARIQKFPENALLSMLDTGCFWVSHSAHA
jgi:hypothetical protein